jgi:hypothetical protein
MLTTEEIVKRFTDLIRQVGVVFKGRALTAGIGKKIAVRISKGTIQAYSYNVASTGLVDVIYDSKTNNYFCWQALDDKNLQQSPNIFRQRKKVIKPKLYPFKISGLNRIKALEYKIKTGWNNDEKLIKTYKGESNNDYYSVVKVIHEEEAEKNVVVFNNKTKGVLYIVNDSDEQEYSYPVNYEPLFNYIYPLGDDKLLIYFRNKNRDVTSNYTLTVNNTNIVLDEDPLEYIKSHKPHAGVTLVRIIGGVGVPGVTETGIPETGITTVVDYDGAFTYNTTNNLITNTIAVTSYLDDTSFYLDYNNVIDLYTFVHEKESNGTSSYNYTYLENKTSILKVGLYNTNAADVIDHTTNTVTTLNYNSTTSFTGTRETISRFSPQEFILQTTGTGGFGSSSSSEVSNYSIVEEMPDLEYKINNKTYKTKYNSNQTGSNTITNNSSYNKSGFTLVVHVIDGVISDTGATVTLKDSVTTVLEEYTTIYNGEIFTPLCSSKDSLFYKYSVIQKTISIGYDSSLSISLHDQVNNFYYIENDLEIIETYTVTNSLLDPYFTPNVLVQPLASPNYPDKEYYLDYLGSTYTLDLSNSYFFVINFDLEEIQNNVLTLQEDSHFYVRRRYTYSYGYNYYSMLTTDKQYPVNFVRTTTTVKTLGQNEADINTSANITGYRTVNFDFNNTPAYIFHRELDKAYLLKVTLEEVTLQFNDSITEFGIAYGMNRPTYMRITVHDIQTIEYFALEEGYSTILVSEDMLHYVLVQCVEKRNTNFALNTDVRGNKIYISKRADFSALASNPEEWYCNIFTLDLETLKFKREEVVYPTSEISTEGSLIEQFGISILEDV